MQIIKKGFKKLLSRNHLAKNKFNPLLSQFSDLDKQYSINRKNWDFYQGQIKASLKAANKAYLRTKFESTLVEEARVEVPALRLRRQEDTLSALKEKGQVGCYLISEHGDETIHFVLEKGQVNSISRLKDASLRHIYLHIEGREYRCTYYRADIHPIHNFSWRVYFRRFEEGQKNRVNIPLRIKYKKEFFHYKRHRAEFWLKRKIDCIVYSGVYPKAIEIDSELLVKRGNIQVGDLNNFLPPGIEVCPEENLEERVVEMVELDNPNSGKEKFYFDEDTFRTIQSGKKFTAKKDKEESIEDKVFNIEERYPFPKMGQYGYKKSTRRPLTEKEKARRPTNLKTIIKNMNLQVSGENVIDERK